MRYQIPGPNIFENAWSGSVCNHIRDLQPSLWLRYLGEGLGHLEGADSVHVGCDDGHAGECQLRVPEDDLPTQVHLKYWRKNTEVILSDLIGSF